MYSSVYSNTSVIVTMGVSVTLVYSSVIVILGVSVTLVYSSVIV